MALTPEEVIRLAELKAEVAKLEASETEAQVETAEEKVEAEPVV